MTYNPKIKNTAANKVTIDADINATNINLGVAEDDNNNALGEPTYLDGLFSFDTDTTVGVAIDRINEVLGKLAPPPAPALDSLNSATSGLSQYLALNGVTSNNATEEQVQELTRTPDLAPGDNGADSRYLVAVDGDKGEFNSISDGNVGGNKYRRLGIFHTRNNLSFILNGTVPANNQGNEENYGNFSYDTSTTPNDAPPPLEVYFNGSLLQEGLDYTRAEGVTNKAATFASAETFEPFVHSQTTITLIADWRPGHNYIQVIYNGSDTSSYVDWVFAPDEASSGPQFAFQSTADPVITLPDLTDSANTKFISGIEYIKNTTDFTVQPPSDEKITNYALQSFPKNYGVSIPAGVVAAKSANASNFNHLSDVDIVNKNIDISGLSTKMGTSQRVLDSNINFTVSVNNEFLGGRTRTKSYTSAEKYMFDSFSETDGAYTYTGGSQTKVMDEFNHESYRVDPAAAAAWTPIVNNEPSPWNSNTALTTGNALVYEGRLYHPKRLTTALSPNFPSQNVDYSTLSGVAVYYRKFKKTAGANTSLKFKIYGNATFDTVGTSGKWWLQVQNAAGTWLDVCVNNNTLGGAAEGSGLQNVTIDANGKEFGIVWNANVNGGAPIENMVYLIKITAPESTASSQYIEKLVLTNG